MKCIKKGTKVQRVSNEEADRLVTTAGWHYIDKHAWRHALATAKLDPIVNLEGKNSV